MQRPIAAPVLLLVGGWIALAAACGGGGSTTGPPVPHGWNKHASSEGLTLIADPPTGQVWSTVLARGRVSTELAHVGDKVSVQFWPEGAFRTLGKDEESKYKGDIWSSTEMLAAYVGPDGTFETDPMKIPRAIKVGDEIRLVVPGQYWFALILDDKHAVFAPFEVTPEQPLPTVSPAPYLRLGSFQFLDAKTGWLGASSCRDQPRATPDEYGNQPTQAPPVCKARFYGTTDGGQTWSLLSGEAPVTFTFSDLLSGLALGGCENPCKTSVLRTTDGGKHWTQTFRSPLALGGLSVIEGEAWLLGDNCGSSDRGSCQRYLLKSTDGGSSWSRMPLPITGLGISISRPTKHDAWIATRTGADTAKLFATRDDGATWTQLVYPGNFSQSLEIFFRTPVDGWLYVGGQASAGSQFKELFGTTDGGQTWAHLTGGKFDLGYLGPMVFTSNQNGWMAVPHAGLLHSTDDGRTWTFLSVDNNYGGQQAVVQFADPEHGWTVTDYYSEHPFQLQQALWTTSDGGATWQKLPLPAPESP